MDPPTASVWRKRLNFGNICRQQCTIWSSQHRWATPLVLDDDLKVIAAKMNNNLDGQRVCKAAYPERWLLAGRVLVYGVILVLGRAHVVRRSTYCVLEQQASLLPPRMQSSASAVAGGCGKRLFRSASLPSNLTRQSTSCATRAAPTKYLAQQGDIAAGEHVDACRGIHCSGSIVFCSCA